MNENQFETLEQMVEVQSQQKELFIGIPKERGFQEHRVALTPQGVALLVDSGHQVWVESGAGENAFFSDRDYSEAGAKIIYETEEIYKAHILLKIGPVPESELDFLQAHQCVFSALHLPSLSDDYIKAFIAKKATGFAYEYVKDAAGSLPIVRSLSEIAGTSSILIAAEYLNNPENGSGLLLGGITGIPPTKVLILGAGTVGEFAARTALGLGADVKVFDDSLYRLRRLQSNLNSKIYTSTIQPNLLSFELKTTDVVIGALAPKNGITPMIVSKEMIENMPQGAVIVDVSIDHGGCFETSEMTNHSNPTFEKFGVTHYAVPNICSRVSKTASQVMSNILTPILLEASQHGGIENYIWQNKGLRDGIYCFNNNLTNKDLSKKFNIKFTNLELIAAARF